MCCIGEEVLSLFPQLMIDGIPAKLINIQSDSDKLPHERHDSRKEENDSNTDDRMLTPPARGQFNKLSEKGQINHQTGRLENLGA